jgi:hypothetical protein
MTPGSDSIKISGLLDTALASMQKLEADSPPALRPFVRMDLAERPWHRARAELEDLSRSRSSGR